MAGLGMGKVIRMDDDDDSDDGDGAGSSSGSEDDVSHESQMQNMTQLASVLNNDIMLEDFRFMLTTDEIIFPTGATKDRFVDNIYKYAEIQEPRKWRSLFSSSVLEWWRVYPLADRTTDKDKKHMTALKSATQLGKKNEMFRRFLSTLLVKLHDLRVGKNLALRRENLGQKIIDNYANAKMDDVLQNLAKGRLKIESCDKTIFTHHDDEGNSEDEQEESFSCNASTSNMNKSQRPATAEIKPEAASAPMSTQEKIKIQEQLVEELNAQKLIKEEELKEINNRIEYAKSQKEFLVIDLRIQEDACATIEYFRNNTPPSSTGYLLPTVISILSTFSKLNEAAKYRGQGVDVFLKHVNDDFVPKPTEDQEGGSAKNPPQLNEKSLAVTTNPDDHEDLLIVNPDTHKRTKKNTPQPASEDGCRVKPKGIKLPEYKKRRLLKALFEEEAEGGAPQPETAEPVAIEIVSEHGETESQPKGAEFETIGAVSEVEGAVTQPRRAEPDKIGTKKNKQPASENGCRVKPKGIKLPEYKKRRLLKALFEKEAEGRAPQPETAEPVTIKIVSERGGTVSQPMGMEPENIGAMSELEGAVTQPRRVEPDQIGAASEHRGAASQKMISTADLGQLLDNF